MDQLTKSAVFVVMLCASAVAWSQGRKEAFPSPPRKTEETSHLVFVAEYVRELTALDELHTKAKSGLDNEPTSEVFSEAIYYSTRMDIELKGDIATLKGMRLNPPYDKLIPGIVDFYATEDEAFRKLMEISSTMAAGPKPGVDYPKLGAEIPKLRARIDYIEQSLFEAVSPVIFLSLVDQKPDSENRVSHLLITKAERTQLIDQIDSSLGLKFDQKEFSYQVGGAKLLKEGLVGKGYKASDEP
jgi:hypothetical protein